MRIRDWSSDVCSSDLFSSQVPQLQAKTDEVVRQMMDTGSSSSQIYIAMRQLLLADRMLRRVTVILQGGAGAVSAADAFSRDAQGFAQVLQGLERGNAEMGPIGRAHV